MYFVGRIRKEIYQCITSDCITDEVIITDKQVEHIKQRHPNDYERYGKYLTRIVEDPDYIIEANRKNTALVLKEFVEGGEVFKTVVRLVTSMDDVNYKNSVITFMKIDNKEWRNSYNPHAAGTDRGNPRDAGELYACQTVPLY